MLIVLIVERRRALDLSPALEPPRISRSALQEHSSLCRTGRSVSRANPVATTEMRVNPLVCCAILVSSAHLVRWSASSVKLEDIALNEGFLA